MKIDGKELAEETYKELGLRIAALKGKQIVPHLVVILVGEDPSSKAYITQKQNKSHQIDAGITIITLPESVSQNELILKIMEANDDPHVHGVIVQRPLPYHIDDRAVDLAVLKEKDVDGFRPDSPFDPPVAEAVYQVIAFVQNRIAPSIPLFPWPEDIKVVLLGKGDTAGKPVHKLFEKLDIPHQVIDTKTENAEILIRRADIIISAVGKKKVLTPEMVKKDVILIGIGLHLEPDGKLRGDYDDEDMSGVASFYTPTPRGVGPLNVAMLLKNVVEAAEKHARDSL